MHTHTHPLTEHIHPLHTLVMHSDPYVKVTFTGRNRVTAHSGHKTQVIKKVSPLHISLSLFFFLLVLLILLFPPPPPPPPPTPPRRFILDGTKRFISRSVNFSTQRCIHIWCTHVFEML